ncbi:MAG: SHOCT domain-containing protein [Spirochaetes bacterium]|nr:SHOCT domain-containing protein [Spirochaetota bacterium]
MWGSYCNNLFGFWRNPFGLGGIFMFIFWFLLFGLLIFAVYLIINKSKVVSGSKENALDILKKRYAAGEIGKEEYEEKKKEIIQ